MTLDALRSSFCVNKHSPQLTKSSLCNNCHLQTNNNNNVTFTSTHKLHLLPLLKLTILLILTITTTSTSYITPTSCQQLVAQPSTSTSSKQEQEATASTSATSSNIARQLIDSSNGGGSSVNVNSIIAHQDALAKECAKYHQLKVNEYRKINKLLKDFSERDVLNEQEDDERSIYWHAPVPVQVPAICLFGFSQFSHLNNEWNQPAEVQQETSGKLDLVNWFYDNLDDGLAKYDSSSPLASVARSLENNNNNNNKSKRAVGGGGADLFAQDSQDFLQDYLFDASKLQEQENEIDTDANAEAASKYKFQQNVEKLLQDQAWRSSLQSERERFSSRLSPVILVPGLLGSRLQARVDKEKRVNLICKKKSDWQDMWLSIRQLLPVAVDCWLDNVRLEYNPSTGWTRAPAGVQVRVAEFGSVESVRSLDLNQPTKTEYFAKLIDRYEQLGYKADENLLAAPYDFRLAPQELTSYFHDLKQLVEQAMSTGGGGGDPMSSGSKKVTLVCHSMGCTHLLVFLRLQSSAWRQKYVRKMIALSSPWGGAIKALKALVVGDQLELPLVSESKMRKLARTYPSIAFLLPQAEVFQRSNGNRPEPLEPAAAGEAGAGPIVVETPQQMYRVGQLPQLMRDLNLTHQLEWFKMTSSLIKPLEPLADLHVDCIHSLNSPTPERMIFKREEDFPNGKYELVKGDGDGTVNLESLLVCEHWASKLPQKVKHIVIMNTNHIGVLSHKTTLNHITQDVLLN